MAIVASRGESLSTLGVIDSDLFLHYAGPTRLKFGAWAASAGE
jgi:hypothetical protein